MASYNIMQAKPTSTPTNLLCVLVQSQNMTIPNAMAHASSKITKSLSSFLGIERALVGSSNGDGGSDIACCVRGLRAWITGFAHWVYESELYFQGEGEEVKTFGWVFTMPRAVDGRDPVERWIQEVKGK